MRPPIFCHRPTSLVSQCVELRQKHGKGKVPLSKVENVRLCVCIQVVDYVGTFEVLECICSCPERQVVITNCGLDGFGVGVVHGPRLTTQKPVDVFHLDSFG